jgi:hypothetical protein
LFRSRSKLSASTLRVSTAKITRSKNPNSAALYGLRTAAEYVALEHLGVATLATLVVPLLDARGAQFSGCRCDTRGL